MAIIPTNPCRLGLLSGRDVTAELVVILVAHINLKPNTSDVDQSVRLPHAVAGAKLSSLKNFCYVTANMVVW